jgi:hypothetical protein
VLCTPWLGGRLTIGMVVGGAFEMLHPAFSGSEAKMDVSAARQQWLDWTPDL